MTTTDLRWRVSEGLGEILRHERRDAIGFTLAIVLLTAPMLVGGLVVFALVSPLADVPHSAWMSGPRVVLLAINLLLGGMLWALLLRQQPDPRRNPMPWLLGALLAMGAIAGLGHGTTWMDRHPSSFWPVIAGLVLTAMAMLGRVYEPGDDYYLGWVAGPYVFNDLTTLEDDVDRRHIALGLAAAIPHAILSAYGEVFGSGWLWRSLDAAERDACADFLIGADEGRGQAAMEGLALQGSRRAARILRALSKLGLIRHSDRGLGLTTDGRSLVETARGLRERPHPVKPVSWR